MPRRYLYDRTEWLLRLDGNEAFDSSKTPYERVEDIQDFYAKSGLIPQPFQAVETWLEDKSTIVLRLIAGDDDKGVPIDIDIAEVLFNQLKIDPEKTKLRLWVYDYNTGRELSHIDQTEEKHAE